MGKLEEMAGRFKFRCCENKIETLPYFKMTLSLSFKFFKNLSPYLYHFVT